MEVKDTTIPLISIIVPIYNVKKYIRKCLDSLKNQSMKQIEVICIDDGSTDNSGRIAEEYKADPRFRIIHTENRGLSAARNRGIDEVKTDWIMFVDSDDWVDEKFCEIPYQTAVENCADLVIFRSCRVKRGRIKKYRRSYFPTGIIDEFTAFEYGAESVWNKMYKKTHFKNIHFPEGRVYEDVATTYKFVHNAKRIYLLNECLYFHTDREGSITNMHSLSNHKDSFIANVERYQSLIAYGYPEEKLIPSLCSSAMGYLASVYPSENLLTKKAVEIVDSTKSFPISYPVWKRGALLMWKFDIRLFYLVSKFLFRR